MKNLNKKIFLDIVSLINSNYYENSSRINWHISHEKYDSFANDLYKMMQNINLKDKEKEVFNIIKPLLYNTLSSYLTHVYDYVILKEKNYETVFSEKNSDIYINKIYSKKSIKTIFAIELEKKRFKKLKLKTFYSFLVKLLPKNIFDYLLILKNKPVDDFLLKKSNKNLKVLLQYYFKINTNNSPFSNNLSKKIASDIISCIEKKYFTLDIEHKESVKTIVNILISRSYNDIMSYDGFLNGSKRIITGTGNNYYNRLISSVVRKNNTKIIRFAHGGERCFFRDTWYWDNELFQTDEYITYGIRWAEFVKNEAIKRGKEVIVKAFGSSYYQELFDTYFGKKLNNKTKVLYIPNSFVGEARQFPCAKIIDPILFDWQKYLIELLQKNGFEVIYKKHPKGFFQEENILGNLALYESTKPMREILNEVDTVICDMAGTAFVESLCAGKDIVLIDTKQRVFNCDTKKDLQKAVKIIDTYWQNNLICVDEKELVSSIRNFDILDKNKKEIINDYFLSKGN